MDPVRIGSLVVQRIEETCGPGFPPEMLLPDLPADALQRRRDWMVPRYYDPGLNLLVARRARVDRRAHDRCYGE